MQGIVRFVVQALALVWIAPSVWAVTYTLEFEGGGTSNPSAQVGDVVNLAFTSTDLNTNIWGNVEISYDPALLQALYVDEPFDSYGFWTWWTDMAGKPELCGSGQPYSYYTSGGSAWADQWAGAYGEGAGPSAYIDQQAGKIRFYHNNYLVAGNHLPLRLGFRVLALGSSLITIKSGDEPTRYDWCNFDTVTSTNLQLGINVMTQLFMLGVPDSPTDRQVAEVYAMLKAASLPAATYQSIDANLKKVPTFLGAGQNTAATREVNAVVAKLDRALEQGELSPEAATELIGRVQALLSTP